MREFSGQDAGGNSSEGFALVWGMVRRQRNVVLVATAAGLLVGTVAAMTQKRTYQATTVLRVDERRTGLPSFDPRAGAASWSGIQIGSEIEVLRSRNLAATVADSLKLQLQVVGLSGVARDDLFASIEVEPDAPGAIYQFAREDDGRLRITEVEPERSRLSRIRSAVDDQVDRLRGREKKQVPFLRGDTTSFRSERTYVAGDTAVLPGASVVLAPLTDSLADFRISISSLDGAVGSVTGGTRVRQATRDAGIIYIEFRGRDRKLVREVPNVLAANFLSMRRRTQQTEVRSAMDFLRHQLDSIGIQLAATEYELQSFREANRVVDLDSERSAQVRRLADLQAERASLDVERSALQQLVDELGGAGRTPTGQSNYRRLAAFPTLLRSSATADIVRSISRLEDERAALLTRRQPSDPDVRALTGRIEQLEGEFSTTVMTYLDGLSNQIRTIDSQLAQSQREASRIPEKEARYARLTRQTSVLQDVYGTLKQRLTEAEVLHAVEDPSVRIVDVATASVQPLTARRAFVFGSWLIIGFVLGTGVGLVREYRDGSVRSRADLQVAAGVPVLGLIPRMVQVDRLRRLSQANGATLARLRSGSGENQRVAVVPAPSRTSKPTVPLLSGGTRMSMIAAEAYRRLHLAMLRARPGVSTRVFLITSALPGDGKTTTAANLAITLAQRGYRIALIDADLRQGPLKTLFGAEGPGLTLTDLLSAPKRPENFVEYTRPVLRSSNGGRDTGLDLIVAGKAPVDPAILLDSPRFPELIEWLRSVYDIVIVDSPPAAIVTDAAAIGPYVDGVIMVARAGVTPFDALQYVANQFRASQVTVLGTVLNDLEMGGQAGEDSSFRWYEYGKDYFTPPVTAS